MSDNRPNQQTPDAAEQRERENAQQHRNEPWTGQGPVIRNLPNSSQPYGASPEQRPSRPARSLSPWIVVAIIALIAIVIAGLVLAIVL
ncbi:hypothetical protein [Paramicrobacterium agarici]|uniref:Uncharacterized protein n=1 Tax=Paramicrobacterium agarici TaxID=630514 RepID=A0A2A9DTD5_9MICO|nr:hypothetical protein [Microbacterium agarici]PFG29190.1 hypothetical protein ATJ78_0087 [Microbacterium agarici]TQO22154.1 hypothetical protein FB385_0973 [Microbacterium agarici]